MESTGRRTGLALAAALTLAVSLVLAAVVGWRGHGLLIAAVAAGFAVALVPLGWLLGGRYDRVKAWSEKDGLTGAFNRGFVMRCFPRLAEQALRNRKKLSVTVIDVNDFKQINDTYGHLTGDRVLVRLAETLLRCGRHGEIVGRWGGDEFLMLCPYVDKASIEALHRRIEESMEALSVQENKRFSVSIGTALFPDDGRQLDALTQAADQRMYSDKHRRKGTETAKLQA